MSLRTFHLGLTDANAQIAIVCLCLVCNPHVDSHRLPHCSTVRLSLAGWHCNTVLILLYAWEWLCTERVQRLIANDLTAHAEAATLFLLLSLWLLLLCCAAVAAVAATVAVAVDVAVIVQRWPQRGLGWLRWFGLFSSAAGSSSSLSCSALVSLRFGPLSAAFAAYLCISLYFLSRTRCAASQPKQRPDSGCAAGPFAQRIRALSHTRKTIFSFFCFCCCYFFFFFFYCYLCARIFIVKLNFRHGNVQDVRATLTST